jgi:hypothetical protein
MTTTENPDHGRTPKLQALQAENAPGVAGNERLTALAGAVLLALIVAEIATIPNIRALMSTHVVVGVLLAGPLAVKTASTGWRFIRYYTGHPAYRRKGPPRPIQRTLSPLLLITTLVVIGSGIALVDSTPGTYGPLYITHKVSFLALTALLAIHLLAYLRRVPRLIAADWRHNHTQPAPGRGHRLATNLAALVAAAVAAILILPAFAPWTHLTGLTHR